MRGKVAVITGGNGFLGSHYLQLLKKAGARTVCLDVAPSLRQPSTIIVDVTRRESVEAAYAAIEARYGCPDILINNAGIDTPPNAPGGRVSFEAFPADAWDRTLDVNLKGTFFCCQVIGGAMAKKGRGSVINVGSLYGLRSPDQRIYAYMNERGKPAFVKPVAYAASKSGVMNLTRYLAAYWGPRHVRVNTLVPGGMFNGQHPKFLKSFSNKVPLGRMGRTEELDGAILYLASDASSYVTGTSLVVDGGYNAW